MIDSSSEETELQNEEVKPSWSFSYIALIIVLSIANIILGGILGKYFFDQPEKRILTVTETRTENLLNLDRKVYDEIITSYTLRNTPSETVKSYFRYSATIRNDGDMGVEKLKVFVQVNGSDIILVKSPSITTVPPDIHQGITLQQNKKVVEASKDEWEVSLLNRHESITFTYIGYSTKEVNNASFKLVPRKKDWEVIRKGAKTFSESNSRFDKTDTEKREEILSALLVMSVCGMFVFASIFLLILFSPQRSRRLFELQRSRGLFGQRSAHDESDSSSDST
jgi:hypothetical protein